MKFAKSVKSDMLTVKVTLDKLNRGEPGIKITTSNVLCSPELSGYNIQRVVSKGTIVSSIENEVTGEWVFKLNQEEKPEKAKSKSTTRKTAKVSDEVDSKVE